MTIFLNENVIVYCLGIWEASKKVAEQGEDQGEVATSRQVILDWKKPFKYLRGGVGYSIIFMNQ